ncbi:TfoX/Sxy family protein [Vibrio mediterranei]|uniref:TfoX/Sxy family protein n=1 Tax=Vibrio mediterranei TaxID=689 RepID=UPI0013DE44D3|nr:TfoX/Sxy family protein [Vibrio mediterranei]MCG9790834.1 TfoX/Sxy family protein [Vibrio mediterranei]
MYRKLIGGKISNIRDAYNLTKTHESQSRRSGIQSFEQLVRMGSIEAYKALCEARHTDPYPINRKLLWQLEGAIQNVHWCVLSKETKERLLNGF